MKNLSLIFIGCFCLTLISCKTRFDNLAANSNDDVYNDPARDTRPVAKINPDQKNGQASLQQTGYQNQQQGYNANAGKIAATHVDSMNPNYKDPNFNYDDYYDNAYASRVSRFQNPIYGIGYYDSYYTNQYSYTGNPSTYGNSIYNSYPSNMYNSYNNYGMGNYGMSGYSMGYGGYGNGMSMSYGMGSMGMGYGMNSMYGSGYGMGYNPFSMGYSPYGMCGMGNYGMYGYNPYGGYGYNPYGMGYSPYGMNMYSPYSMGYMGSGGYSTGYYNPYDYNSVNTYNGPRTSPSGGNSVVTANTSGPRTGHREEAPVKNGGIIAPGVSPFTPERFNQVSIPKENLVKIAEAKNPTRINPEYQPVRNVYSGGAPENSIPKQNNFNNTPRTNTNASENIGRTKINEGNQQQTRPTKWYNSSNENSYSRPVNNFENNNSFSTPTRMNNSGSWGGGGGSFGGGSHGGGGGGHSGGRR